jgi:membrane protein
MITNKLRSLHVDVWRSRLEELSGFRAFWVRLRRVAVLSFRGLFNDQLRASALTYYSALSVVPFVALLFGIARGFGYEQLLQKQLLEKLAAQHEAVARISGFAHSLLGHTQGGLIAGIGIVFLFYSVILVLMSIENYFNEIWHVERGRPFRRKISDYLAFMLIAPFLFVTASGLTVFFTTEVKTIVKTTEFLGAIKPAIFYLLNLLPYVTIWLLFTFMYIFMPNTKVHFKTGLLAGFLAGSTFQLFQWAYITFQIGVARYNAIYGSFAALPLFLIWLQLSWTITLIGAEIAYAYQNAALFDYEPDCKAISPSLQRLLNLGVVHLLVRDFADGQISSDEPRVAEKLGIPPLLLRQILDQLVDAGIVSRIKKEADPKEAYQPARRTDQFTIKRVIELLEKHGTNEIPTIKSEEFNEIAEALKTFADEIELSSANKRLLSF